MTPQNFKIEILLLKKENSKCNSAETLKSLFITDAEVSFTKRLIKVKDASASYKIATGIVEVGGKERYFSLNISKNAALEESDKAIEDLSTISRKIKTIISESGLKFKYTPIWDDTSLHYSKLSYPLLFEVENLMRKLIYKFMLTKLGTDWLKHGTPDEFKKDLNKKEKATQDTFLETVLYNADFIHVINFLFRKYTTDTTAIFDKISGLEKIEDITLEEIQQCVPTDNWTRYFSSVIQYDSFRKKWEELYELRCKVAHNTLVTKGDYEQIVSLSVVLKEKLEAAIDSISEIKIEEEELKDLSKSAINSFSNEVDPQAASRYISYQDLLSTTNYERHWKTQPLLPFSDAEAHSAGNIYFEPNTSTIKSCKNCGSIFMPRFGSGKLSELCSICENGGRVYIPHK